MPSPPKKGRGGPAEPAEVGIVEATADLQDRPDVARDC